MSEENIAAVRRLFDEGWSEGNLEVVDEICADDFDRFEDGKIAESWAQWDTLRLMRNIGAA